MTEKIGLREKLVPVKVSSLRDLARMAATIIALGQATYIIRFSRNGKLYYGLVALLRDYYDLYGLPLFYYHIRDDNEEERRKHYLLVKLDEQGEHVELSASTRPGWVAVPIIDLEAPPSFIPENLA